MRDNENLNLSSGNWPDITGEEKTSVRIDPRVLYLDNCIVDNATNKTPKTQGDKQV